MSVSTEFASDPVTWITTHRFVTPTASYVGAPGAFTTGDGSFKFEDAGAGGGGYLLKKAGTFDLVNYFNAFYLAALPNNDNTAVLTSAHSRFLNADLSGCQFLAYGTSRSALTVEHNNYFAGGAATYAGRYAQITGMGYNIVISLRPSPGPTANAHEYNILEGANVVGIKQADGWHFHVRKQTDRAVGTTMEL